MSKLPVRYFSQNDSATDEGYRMCQSSVVSMAVCNLAPNALKVPSGQQPDDFWLKQMIEAKGGNTNDPQAHLRAMKSLGFDVRLSMSGSFALVDQQLSRGIPVPMVIAHHGPASNPDTASERWHWILCIGKTTDGRGHIYHDPNGELDNVNGGYVNHSRGESVTYSDKNLRPRWETDGPGRGWCYIFSPPWPAK